VKGGFLEGGQNGNTKRRGLEGARILGGFRRGEGVLEGMRKIDQTHPNDQGMQGGLVLSKKS